MGCTGWRGLAICRSDELLTCRIVDTPTIHREGWRDRHLDVAWIGFVRARAIAPWLRKAWVGNRAASHRGRTKMRCLECGSEAVTERPERTAHGYRRFRCRACVSSSMSAPAPC